jgi:hypothetical protein
MSLKDLYENASENSYVGRVRTRQSSDAGAGQGSNYMDGTPRQQNNSAPDEFQKEFTRNNAGAFKYGGDGKTPAATNDKSYPLSRWLSKAFKLAFEGQGPTTLPNGFFTNRFRVINDAKNFNKTVHNYAPLPGLSFREQNSDAKKRIDGSPAGPQP